MRRFAPLLVALLVIGAAAGRAEDAPAAGPGAPPPAADSFCETCRRGVTWEMDRCPGCGAEFEPLRPRVRKGEGQPAAPTSEGAAARGESPFPAPAPGAPPDMEAPDAGIIPSPWPQIRPPERSRFGFGSYGRVGFEVGTDLDGARPVDIASFQPRLAKGPYQELHFFYKDALAEMPVLVKMTPAFDEKVFAYDADFDARFALREAYVEVEPAAGVAVWVGARMYRGDQIYLFDFWPLDDQNTLGGGAAARSGPHRIQGHLGVNQISDDDGAYYFQEVDVPLDDAVGSRRAVFLDRNRGTASLTYGVDLPMGAHAKVHGEATYLPPGRRRTGAGGATLEHLPADHGFAIGGQVGARADGGSSADLFVKYGRGLAAYDELEVPFGFDTDLEVTDAERILIALGGGLEGGPAGALFAAYWQRFVDADGVDDREDSDEFAISARPLIYLGKYGRAGLEATWEGKRHRGVFIETGEEELQSVTKLSLLVGLAPERGLLARPELLAVFTLKWLDEEAALDLARTRFAEKPDRTEQTFGLFAEWWF